MQSFSVFVLTCLLAIQGLAQISPTIPPKPYTYADFPESKASSKNMKIISIDKNSYLVSYRPNVKYSTRDGTNLTLQIIEPTFLNGKRPCIVYVQGSAWMKQNVYANLPQLAEFARRGYVIAVVEYRPSSVAKFPAQLQDAKTAIRFMREHAADYQVDVNNVFIWGDSSGGHTALLVGLTQNNPELDTKDMSKYPITVNAVVDFYGPTDITQMNVEPSTMDHIGPRSPEGQLLGGKNVLENQAQAAATNPINYIKDAQNGAPILIIHGSKDRLVPFQQSVLLADALDKNNYRYQFYQLKGADHGSAEFWSRETFDLVDAFLKRYTVKN